MRYARLFKDKIVEIIDTPDIYKIMHQGMADKFIAIDNKAQIGWELVDGKFIAPDLKKIEEDRKTRLKKLVKLEWENIISKHFSDKELMHMQLALSAGKQKASDVYAWIQSGINKAILYQCEIDGCTFTSASYEDLGAPPHSYEEVIKE